MKIGVSVGVMHDNGTMTQQFWIVSERMAELVRLALGDPDDEVLMSGDAVRQMEEISEDVTWIRRG